MELLVVITIIGILVALLLPAIQAAREAARRMTCQNNLRQMGIACHNYNTTIGTFPPGSIICGGSSNETNRNIADGMANWCIALLPYLELQPLFDRYDHKSTNTGSLRNIEVIQSSVTVYQCPSDSHANDLNVPEAGQAGPTGWYGATGVKLRHGSYRACAGLSDGTFTWTVENQNIAWNWALGGKKPTATGNLKNPSANPRPTIGWRGVMHVVPTGPVQVVPGTGSTGPTTGLKCESMSAIQDGTSNTLMIGEYSSVYAHHDSPPRPGIEGENDAGAYWGYSWTDDSICPSMGEVTWVGTAPYPLTYYTLQPLWYPEPNGCWKMVSAYGNACRRQWASLHPPGGLNYVLCDGSTRWVNSTVDPVLLGHMASIAGGRPDEANIVP